MAVTWSGLLEVATNTTIHDALLAIDKGSAGTAVAVDREGRLLGVVTDGDIRRYLLRGGNLHGSLEPVLNKDPLTVPEHATRASVLDLMQAYEVAVLPVVAEDRRLTGVHLFRKVIGKQPRHNLCVILAGGRGSRLGAVTTSTPKPMVRVAGRPILERLILHFMSYGVSRFVISVGHLADVIEDYFGDGERFGCAISYVRDPAERPLGTAGPLTLLDPFHLEQGAPVIVVNGDLLTQTDVGGLLSVHEHAGADVTVGVHTYSHQVPFGVVNTDAGGLITSLDEKPDHHWQVSAGMYVLARDVVSSLPRASELSMTDLLQDLIAQGKRVCAFEVDEEWMDVGTPGDLQRARGR